MLLSQTGSSQDWFSLNKQGVGKYHSGDYIGAEVDYISAIKKAESNHGKVSDPYITSINNYAFLLKETGRIAESLSYFKQASKLSKLLHGELGTGYLEAQSQVSSAYLLVGKYDSCEFNLNTSLKVFNRLESENESQYKEAIFKYYEILVFDEVTRASLYHHRGQTSNSIKVLESQISGLKEVFGDEIDEYKPYYEILANLTTYYIEQEDYKKAKPLTQSALRYYQVKEDVRNTSSLMNSLASIYYATGQTDSAIYFWQQINRALKSSAQREGQTSLSVLNNLGSAYLELEQYDSALWYLEEAYALQDDGNAVIPKVYKITLYNLSETYRWMGSYAKAETHYQLLINRLIEETIHEFTYLNEAEQRAFYKSQLFYIEAYQGFALEVSGLLPIQNSETLYISEDIAGNLYNLQLVTKSIVLNASRKMKRQILSGNDEQLKAKYMRWVQLKNQIASIYNADLNNVQGLRKIYAEIGVLETELARSSAKFRQGFMKKRDTWKEVQSTLKKGECTVEMIRVLDGLVYLGLILTPETKESPVMTYVISTKSKHLEKQYLQYYQNAIKHQSIDTLSYSAYWERIANKITDNMPNNLSPKTIYLSADGIYNQINLNTLYNVKRKKYLIDESDVNLLSSSRELVNDTSEVMQEGKEAILFGNPDFGLQGDRLHFTPLPGSKTEVLEVDKLFKKADWKTQVFTGGGASTENLKTYSNASILHLATHGFFNAGDDQHPMQAMLNSGIALSGANDNLEEGLLTAYEASNYDLDDTRLVVLSACETGLGSYHVGEGVYGLQYAMQIAGAENLIMSLWKVDDQATQKLMVYFYSAFIESNDIRSAFKMAQEQLRELYPQPYYWGAFVLMGR